MFTGTPVISSASSGMVRGPFCSVEAVSVMGIILIECSDSLSLRVTLRCSGEQSPDQDAISAPENSSGFSVSVVRPPATCGGFGLILKVES